MLKTFVVTLLLGLVALSVFNLQESRANCVTEEQLNPVFGKLYGALDVLADSIQSLQKKRGAK